MSTITMPFEVNRIPRRDGYKPGPEVQKPDLELFPIWSKWRALYSPAAPYQIQSTRRAGRLYGKQTFEVSCFLAARRRVFARRSVFSPDRLVTDQLLLLTIGNGHRSQDPAARNVKETYKNGSISWKKHQLKQSSSTSVFQRTTISLSSIFEDQSHDNHNVWTTDSSTYSEEHQRDQSRLCPARHLRPTHFSAHIRHYGPRFFAVDALGL